MSLFRSSPYVLLTTVLLLLSLGIIMLFSTGAFAQDSGGDIYYFIRRQSIFMAGGLVLCAVLAFLDYRLLRYLAWPGLIIAAILLGLCFAPIVKQPQNGAHRWIGLENIFIFQPSELSKLALVLFLAAYYSFKPERARQRLQGVVIPFAAAGLIGGLILIEPDFGTAALVLLTAVAIAFIAGVPAMRIIALVIILGLAGGIILTKNDERLRRIDAFLNPANYQSAEAFQTEQSKEAFMRGGLTGQGLGNAELKKHGQLPYAHTDFIFPIIGEEIGLLATLPLLILYMIFAIMGFVISSHARDRFGQLLGYGITLFVCLQAAINIGVTTSLLPNKGLPLPFISYGGTNLIACLAGVGLLLSIYRIGIEKARLSEQQLLNLQPSLRI